MLRSEPFLGPARIRIQPYGDEEAQEDLGNTSLYSSCKLMQLALYANFGAAWNGVFQQEQGGPFADLFEISGSAGVIPGY